MSGKGSISCASNLNAGLFGRYSRIANDLIEAADCFLVVGCKLGEIATKRYDLLPSGVPLIHLDVLEEELGRTTRTEVSLWGDAQAGLDELAGVGSDGEREEGFEEGIKVARGAPLACDAFRVHAAPLPIEDELAKRIPID